MFGHAASESDCRSTDVGSACAGVDFDPVSELLTFTAFSQVNDTRCINVNITDDNEFEGDETFPVQLMTQGNFVSATTVTIVDNEGMAHIVLLSLSCLFLSLPPSIQTPRHFLHLAPDL